MPVRITKLQEMKQAGELIPCMTAYDYPSARVIDAAGIPMILVGDSLGNVVLGYDSTVPVTLEDGTGLVHTAPGHGAEDYQTGRMGRIPAKH